MGDPKASRSDVARLFGRVGFGATNVDLGLWAGQNYAAVVDFLLTRPDANARAAQVDEAARIDLELNGQYNLEQSQRWWLERMRNALYPGEERMTLLWHDHFATGFGPAPFVRALMIQNQSLRVNALGNFRAMVNAMTIDPAMLDWLNGPANALIDQGGGNFLNNINENYAREFFELFTLGVIPQVYTEADIRAAARAFTGWVTFSNNAGTNPAPNKSRFVPGRHDHGVKILLNGACGGPGAIEETEYQQLTDIALAQPIAPYFIAYKIVQSFGYDPDVSNRNLLTAGDPLINLVANSLKATNWDLKVAVKALFMNDLWRYGTLTRVRTPIEVAVHLGKILKVAGTETQFPSVLEMARRMGQVPFQPPNVAGWPNGKAWLSQSAMIARYDVAQVLWNKSGIKGIAPATNQLGNWAAFCGLASFSGTTVNALNQYLAERAASTEAVKQAGILSLIISSPDWQVM